ncbi:U3 small nucleolar ribonucleoprotein protein IMP4-like [Carassius carassius]|uniref:U3 small nucleolar ribonucleoprotein protein IMP4-like n=1 Tax=Carassius carassius TaxID=217509 RepID=UPI002868CAAA|nr:U3 small nucleolar ribonucleoprotein protein IMP4-like [Carassius carassius]
MTSFSPSGQLEKQKLKSALDENCVLPTEVQKEALELQKLLEFDDEGGEGVSSHMDDEYKWAGVEDPKVMVTTSRDPSSRLKMFAKEMKLMFPGAQHMNRGNHGVKTLLHVVQSVSNILKYLFPVLKEDSRRVITFTNTDDFISFQ